MCDNMQKMIVFFETDVCVFADHVCFSGGVAIHHHMCVMVACWSVFGILCILTYPVRKCVYTVLDHRACYFWLQKNNTHCDLKIIWYRFYGRNLMDTVDVLFSFAAAGHAGSCCELFLFGGGAREWYSFTDLRCSIFNPCSLSGVVVWESCFDVVAVWFIYITALLTPHVWQNRRHSVI